jgi:hypothetical protein
MMTVSSANPRTRIGSNLRTLFAILAANGLALNLEKCVFAVSELDFQGHRISTAGVAPLRDNVQVLFGFP